MRSRTMLLALAMLLASLLTGGAGYLAFADHDADTRAETLVLTGSSTVAPVAAELARLFEDLHPAARVDVQAGGSARGISDARRGLSDIGMVSRALDASEDDLRTHSVARDGIALIVHARNPVERLSTKQIRDIWTGRIRDWSAVGGPASPITVVHKADGRATLGLFLDHFGLDNVRVRADVVVGANQQAIRTVAGSPGAVGYVSIGEAEVEAERGEPIRLLPLDGVEATTANVAAGCFPLVRTLNLVTAGEPSDAAHRFLDFSRSVEVHDLIRERGFVPVIAGSTEGVGTPADVPGREPGPGADAAGGSAPDR